MVQSSFLELCLEEYNLFWAEEVQGIPCLAVCVGVGQRR